MSYIMYSDAYKSLGKIWYCGDFYNIVEIMSDKNISDKTKIKLINHALDIDVMTLEELKELR